MMHSSRDYSEAGSDRQVKVAPYERHKRISQVWERLRQLPGQIDKFIQEQVENGRLTPESHLWWVMIRPNTVREHEAQLDEKGIEELNDMRLSHVNALFWLIIFMGWFWAFIHRPHILPFIHEAAPLFPRASLYQSILQHWEWVALVMAVYYFGTRRVSESVPEQMARFPGAMAVTIIVAVFLNSITSVISGMMQGSLIFSAAVMVAFIGLYSALYRTSKGNPDITILEGAGVIAGGLLGVWINARIYGSVMGYACGAVSLAAVGIGIGIASAVSAGFVWAGRITYMASLISWLIISGFGIQDGVATFLTYL